MFRFVCQCAIGKRSRSLRRISESQASRSVNGFHCAAMAMVALRCDRGRPWKSTFPIGLGSALLLAGCANGGHTATAKQAHSSTPSFSPGYGQNASVIAEHIPGCSGITAQQVQASAIASDALVSTCTLADHQIVIYSWPNAAAESLAASILDTGPPSYSAQGPGWTTVEDDGAPLDMQMSIAKIVARALGGVVERHS